MAWENALSAEGRNKIALICSGGLDSVSLACRLRDEGKLALIISYDYGQRHKKELLCARRCAEQMGVPFHLCDISAIGRSLTGSALTDASVPVPEGHYAAENMRLTIVPNRNVFFLSIAFGIASAQGLDGVAIAVHSGDHAIYPDCTVSFLTAYDTMEDLALEDTVRLVAPYAQMTKTEIVQDGQKHNAPFAHTWSCYKGEGVHCGRCGTCVERREAFHCAGVSDPVEFADPDYWRTCITEEEENHV